jgi:hypothetical protein
MHWLGKTCAIFIVLASLACTFLTAKLITVRNSWAKKTQAFATTYEKDAAKLQEVQRQYAQLMKEGESASREWGYIFNGINTQVDKSSGRLTVDLGTNFGLKDKQELHGFELAADGIWIYRGTFSIATAQADRSGLVPTWRPRQQDVATWNDGRWRWRTMLPSAHSKRADEQAMSFMQTEETLSDRQAKLAIQEKLIREADQQRKQRVAELVGGDELGQDASLAAEFRQGLTQTLAEVEEERNKVLLANDALRRKVRQTRDAVLSLQQQNEALVQQLPQPAPAVSRRD